MFLLLSLLFAELYIRHNTSYEVCEHQWTNFTARGVCPKFKGKCLWVL